GSVIQPGLLALVALNLLRCRILGAVLLELLQLLLGLRPNVLGLRQQLLIAGRLSLAGAVGCHADASFDRPALFAHVIGLALRPVPGLKQTSVAVGSFLSEHLVDGLSSVRTDLTGQLDGVVFLHAKRRDVVTRTLQLLDDRLERVAFAG